MPAQRSPLRIAALASLLVGVLLALVAVVASPVLATTGGADDDAATSDEAAGPVVDILPVDGYLDPPTASAITDLLDDAAARDSDLVVLQLSHPGVVGVDTDDLAQRIAASPVPVVVFIRPVSTAPPAVGGTLELLAAADVRAASPDALLGPLVPLDVGDAVTDRSGAAAVERLGERWPEGAALFTDDPEQAAGYADEVPEILDLVAAELEPLLSELDGVVVGEDGQQLRLRRDTVSVRFHSLGVLGRLLHAATTPAFIYLLLVVGLGALLFEVFQPGFGVAGVAGLVTLAIAVFGLTVLPVTWWAVLLVVVGMLLFAVDAAVAGFGPVTALATATFAGGSWFFYDSDVIAVNPWLVALATFSALVFFVVVLTVVLRAQAGPEGLAVEQLVGRPGLVRSVLNPEGHVYVDEALWRARWTGEGRRLKVGTPVRVHGVDGAVLLVERFDPDEHRVAGRDDGTTAATATATADEEAGP